jgi:hypothetical protein
MGKKVTDHMRDKCTKTDIKLKHNFMSINANWARHNEHMLASGLRTRGACGARPSSKVINGCRNLGTNAQRVVRTYFTLTQAERFC